jgi:ADP-ribose pyrophosphatase YjhB (NUDIX family)
MVWAGNAKFIHGVSGIVLDKEGRVLLLKHRFWKGQRWGLPSGLAHSGEMPEETLRREVREETGLEVRTARLLRVSMKGKRVMEFLMVAECEGEPEVRSGEILEAKFWQRARLPEGMLEAHRGEIMKYEL